MLKVQTRLASALATMWAILFILALPTGASAQVADVTDAPISFKNGTDRALIIEVNSVLRRNGQEVPIKGKWQVTPGQYLWLEVNGKKINGVVCSYTVRTSDLPPGPRAILEPGQLTDERASVWTWYSWGTTEHGDFCVHFTNDYLKSHLKSPNLVEGQPFNSNIPSAKDRYRDFLQHRIKYIQEAIKQDKELLVKQDWGEPLVRGGFGGVGPAMERSDSPTDVKAAPVAGPLFVLLGDVLGNQIARGKVATEMRLQANRALQQKYQSELKAASTPATTPKAPGGYTPSALFR